MNDLRSLESLLSGLELKTFFSHYEKEESLYIPQISAQATELLELPYLGSINDLIHMWPEQINCYLPGLADEVNSNKISKEEAIHNYQEGRGLFFDDPNRFDPTIDEWLQSIHRDLGLSHLTYSRSLIYAIAKGGGTATHFDQNINLVLQVSGEKKWWLAKNDFVSNPMTRFTLGAPMDLELASYSGEGSVSDPMQNATELTLKPGSLLFVPRGMWHRTEACSDSISLNFTYSSPTWIDLLTSSLRARLAQSSSWRRTANFVNLPEKKEQAQVEFDQLLNDLKAEFHHIQSQDILGMTEFNPERD